jgi:hypothetical protein
MLEFPIGENFYDHLVIALSVAAPKFWNELPKRRIFVTFHQFVFLKLLLKLIFYISF